MLRPASGFEKVEREQDILGGHRRAVREFGRRIQPERHIGAILVGLDGLRNEPVEREGLVERTRHESLEDVAVKTLRSGACAQVERVETVERALEREIEPAAFRRVGIRIGEIRKPRGQRRRAMHGDAVHGRAARGGGRHDGLRARRYGDRGRAGENEEAAPRRFGEIAGMLTELANLGHAAKVVTFHGRKSMRTRSFLPLVIRLRTGYSARVTVSPQWRAIGPAGCGLPCVEHRAAIRKGY